MFSSIECAINWARQILGVHVGTFVPRDARGVVSAAPNIDTFAVVERTGGALDYPHDSPEISVQVWSRSDEKAETMANMLAIACKTKPIDDDHVNAIGVPTLFSYGAEAGGWLVWQVNISLEVNLLD